MFIRNILVRDFHSSFFNKILRDVCKRDFVCYSSITSGNPDFFFWEGEEEEAGFERLFYSDRIAKPCWPQAQKSAVEVFWRIVQKGISATQTRPRPRERIAMLNLWRGPDLALIPGLRHSVIEFSFCSRGAPRLHINHPTMRACKSPLCVADSNALLLQGQKKGRLTKVKWSRIY